MIEGIMRLFVAPDDIKRINLEQTFVLSINITQPIKFCIRKILDKISMEED